MSRTGFGRPMLDVNSVCSYLAGRGVLPSDVAPGRVVALGGGVSNVVFLVEAASQRLVVKQALERLLVEEEWLADTARATSEAAAIEFAHRVTPGAVPRLVDADAEAHALTIAAAPAGWTSWKEALLRGIVDVDVGKALGRLVGTWHSVSARRAAADFDGLGAFGQLRINPYHRTVAERHPDLAGPIAAAIAALTEDAYRRCLVHGDLSPKNVLVGRDGFWVIDFEVAHRGNPAFDLAFLLTHLLLKSVHRSSDAALHYECAMAFLKGYAEAAGPQFVPFDEALGLQIGCLLLARVDGKSPAEYLTSEGRTTTRELGRHLVRDPRAPDGAWRLLGTGKSQ